MRAIREAIAPLTVRDFRRYYFGHTASTFGDALTPLAIAFAVLHLTGSPADLGIVVLSTRIPIIALSLLGGALGDRFSRRNVMLVADLMRFLAQGATAALLLSGTARIWMIVVLQLIAGMGSALFNPASVGLVVSLVGKERVQEANSLLSMSRSITSMLALSVAGALVATIGPGWAILIDAATFLVSAVFLSRLPRALAVQRPAASTGLLAGIKGGLAEVTRRSWLLTSVIHVALTNLIVVAPFLVLGPYVADEHLGGAPAWSAIGIAYALGGLSGGFVAARWKPSRPVGATLAVFLLITPLPALLAVPATLWLLMAAAFLAGLELVIYNVLQTSTVQRHVPEHLIARASSVVTLGSLAAAPLGMGLAGPAAQVFGSGTVLAAGAVLATLITVTALFVPSVWQIQDGPGEDRQAEPVEPAQADADGATVASGA
ncbi:MULTISPECIES: MFS transporter [Streptosporangium]|uniref:MFS family permease n=1 Tax=Streptosporangium brasiliense TaxID=47480 RepID=A0ABT9RIJ3_9ACTN|nr:MFS transporter [Streptosporangium brasiliense]MDP9869113.1 MFS family permease [Streptosporangium brasiliense]